MKKPKNINEQIFQDIEYHKYKRAAVSFYNEMNEKKSQPLLG